MEKSKLAYLILKNLYYGKVLSSQDLGLSKKEYAEILDLMQKKNLISGVKITNLGQDRLLINNQEEGITVSGINYLMENTVLDYEYKMVVSIEEIANGVEVSTTVDINGISHKYKKTFSKPLTDIDIESESFSMVAEGLRREKESVKHAV